MQNKGNKILWISVLTIIVIFYPGLIGVLPYVATQKLEILPEFSILFAAIIIVISYFLIRYFIKELKIDKQPEVISEKFPSGLKTLNILVTLSILAWPLVAFATIFIYDNPHCMILAHTTAISNLVYPIYLLFVTFLINSVFAFSGSWKLTKCVLKISFSHFILYYAILDLLGANGW